MKISEDHRKRLLVGQGTFGSVYAVEVGREVTAYKVVRKVNPQHLYLNEFDILDIVQEKGGHRNVIELLDKEIKPGKLTLVFKFYEYDLSKYLQEFGTPGLPISTVKDFMYQILDGLSFIHDMNIIHRDMKPNNILLNNATCLKIADFGSSEVVGPTGFKSPQKFGAWAYRAPEVFQNQWYGKLVDVWSAGCIFSHIFLGSAIFQAKEEEMLVTIIMKVYEFSKIFAAIGTQGVQLFKKILKINPNKRITARDAMDDPFLENEKLKSADRPLSSPS